MGHLVKGDIAQVVRHVFEGLRLKDGKGPLLNVDKRAVAGD